MAKKRKDIYMKRLKSLHLTILTLPNPQKSII